jgi:hypothetical protein
LTPQPRQNVLFEAGLAFGYKPDRTILVKIGDLRPFSDIYGRHEVRLTNEAVKRQELVNRLIKAGCAVKTAGTDWLKVGNFDLASSLQIPIATARHLFAYYFTESGCPENPIGHRLLVNQSTKTAYHMGTWLDELVRRNAIRWEPQYGAEYHAWCASRGLTLIERPPKRQEL